MYVHVKVTMHIVLDLPIKGQKRKAISGTRRLFRIQILVIQAISQRGSSTFQRMADVRDGQRCEMSMK